MLNNTVTKNGFKRGDVQIRGLFGTNVLIEKLIWGMLVLLGGSLWILAELV